MAGKAFRALQLLTILIGTTCALAQNMPIDVANSKITVHVSKAGLLSAFGDNHEVSAPISSGSVDEGAGHVTLVIEAARLKVQDPQLAPDKRQQVQQRMLSPDVLDVVHFPQIAFESMAASPGPNAQWTVRGQLSLHGVKRPIVLSLRRENGHYLGACTIKQRDFGITPVSIGGGTVKVKDELRVDFDVLTKSNQRP